MSRNRTIHESLSKENKLNRFHWISSVDEIDRHIKRGHGYGDVSLEAGSYSIDELATYLKLYENSWPGLGPLEFNIYEDRCGEGLHYSIYHKTPYTDEDFRQLAERRLEIITAQDRVAIDLIQRFKTLSRERPNWVQEQIARLAEDQDE